MQHLFTPSALKKTMFPHTYICMYVHVLSAKCMSGLMHLARARSTIVNYPYSLLPLCAVRYCLQDPPLLQHGY